jgi:hypothetical protein
MDKLNLLSPAFPPQVAQDSLGRIFAPIPGLCKLETAALSLLPQLLNNYSSKQDAVAASIELAKIFLDACYQEAKESETPNLSIT